MNKLVLISNDIIIEKHQLYYLKSPIDIGNVDIEKISFSNSFYLEKSCKKFNSCKDVKKVKPLYITLPKNI